jgi:hypothetical protein
MALIDSMRNRVAVAFTKVGSTAELYTQTSTSYDEYGTEYSQVESSASIDIVPYNLFGGRINYQPFGDLNEGDSDAVVPWDTSISVKDKLTLNSVEYEVKNKEEYLVKNVFVAIAIRITKKLD